MSKKRNPIDITVPDRPSSPGDDGSYLAEDTKYKENQRRVREQEGHRKWARVNARDRRDEEQQQQSLEESFDNNPLQHPELDKQLFDGYDPNVNPEPPLNTEARREYDKAKKEQEYELKMRLGQVPSTAPKPEGP